MHKSLSKGLVILGNICLFILLMVVCYHCIDRSLAFHSEILRQQWYVPLRIFSILITPPTQLAFWTFLFLWFLMIKPRKHYVLYLYPMVSSLIVTNTLVRFVKVFFGRSRPDMFLIDGIYDLHWISFERIFSSLPSGHAATLAAIMGFLAARHPRYSLLCIGLSVGISLCRVFIGAHYLSDVLIGNFIGLYTSWIIYDHCSKQDNPAYLDLLSRSFYAKKIPHPQPH